MSNPDTTGSNTDSLLTAFPIGIFFLLLTIVLFQFRDSLSHFNLILWVALPLVALIVVTVVNVTSQYISCRKTDVGKAVLGALPSLGTILVGIGVSSISYCRIPVTSVFGPLMIGDSIDVTKNVSTTTINSLKNSNSKGSYGVTPKLSQEVIDNQYPLVTGIGYGFYIMFSMFFGIVIGNGMSAIC
jgi:energy-coupling factor transporter transmembrane protein EcfT